MSPEPIAKQRCSRERFFGVLIIPRLVFLPKASRCWGASSTTFSIRSRPRLPVIVSPAAPLSGVGRGEARGYQSEKVRTVAASLRQAAT